MSYDFSLLSPTDFEDLARDLLGKQMNIRFEAFASGPDEGMDGRYAKGTKTTILQAKHYVGSTFAKLRAALKKERTAIKKLPATRYILATTRALSPGNKRELAAIIGPKLKKLSDILGPADINGLLRKYPEIERSHVKLWLSSGSVLQRIIHSAAYAFTAMSKADIAAKVRVYAPNASLNASRDKLESQHILIISGPPGVGKTTLAEMLSYAYIAEDWAFVPIRSLEDGFAAIVDAKRQIFFFDDFLGKIALDAGALADKDSDLARFMKRVRTSEHARFILTTRAYIFEEARRLSEHLADTRLDISKYVLDVGVYTRRVRAQILYNHLLVADTPATYIKALIESQQLRYIVDHKNYNPRVVEWMTDNSHIKDTAPSEYPKAFIGALANPSRLWDTAFRNHIPRKCQHLILALFFCSQYGVEMPELRAVYDSLHPMLCAKYGLAFDPKDFEEALRILEGGFIGIHGKRVSFINPSLRDFLAEYLDDPKFLADFAKSAIRADWARAVWRHGSRRKQPEEVTRSFARAFRGVARRFNDFSVWRRVGATLQSDDISASNRIEFLVELWVAADDTFFAKLALSLASRPKDGFSSWHDGRNLVELVGKLRSGHYGADVSLASAIAATLETSLIELIESGIDADVIEGISDEAEFWTEELGPNINAAIIRSINAEINDAYERAEGVESVSTLEDRVKAFEKLAARAGTPKQILDSGIAMLKERMEEVAQDTEGAEAPTFSDQSKSDIEVFDDNALTSMFASLLER